MALMFKQEQEQATRNNLNQRYQNQTKQELKQETKLKSDLAQKQRVNGAENKLEESLLKLENGKYGIGSHEILNGTFEQKEQTAQEINNNGLNMPMGSKTVLSTMVSLGDNSSTIEEQSQGILKRRFLGDQARVMAVVAVPLVITNSKGEKVFLGFPEKNENVYGQDYSAEHAILDRVMQKLGRIPKEFILGYAKQLDNGEIDFNENPEHYSNLEQDRIDELYNEQKAIIEQDKSAKDLHEMVSQKNLARLYECLKFVTERNLKEYMQMYQNLIDLAENPKLRETGVRQIIQPTQEQKVDEEVKREDPELERVDEKVVIEENEISQKQAGRVLDVEKILRQAQVVEQIIGDRDKGIEDVKEQKVNEEVEKDQYKDNGERSTGRRILDAFLGLGKEGPGLYEEREVTQRGKSNARTILAVGAREMNPDRQITNEGVGR